MRRLIIYQNYSFFDRAEEYTLYLLQSFADIADRIIVLNNSKLDFREKKKYQDLSDEYYERENIGYDAGAYKDFFQNKSDDELRQWDEVVLVNSTFFGPLYPWKSVFSKMEKQNCDFWGLSKHIGGIKLFNLTIPSHIQSYFIVIRKTVLLDRRFIEFWNTMEYPGNHRDAIIKFEWRFTQYFEGLGYRASTYLEQDKKGRELIYAGGDPSHSKVYELIKECEFPIIKYKSMDIYHYRQRIDVLNYISQNTQYDCNMIDNYIAMLERADKIPLSREKVLDFARKYSAIYVFGHGLYAKNVEFFLNEQGYKVKNFIVSIPVNENEISLMDIDNFNDKGIIVALGIQGYLEVKETIINMVGTENLLLPNY